MILPRPMYDFLNGRAKQFAYVETRFPETEIANLTSLIVRLASYLMVQIRL